MLIVRSSMCGRSMYGCSLYGPECMAALFAHCMVLHAQSLYGCSFHGPQCAVTMVAHCTVLNVTGHSVVAHCVVLNVWSLYGCSLYGPQCVVTLWLLIVWSLMCGRSYGCSLYCSMVRYNVPRLNVGYGSQCIATQYTAKN